MKSMEILVNYILCSGSPNKGCDPKIVDKSACITDFSAGGEKIFAITWVCVK